MDRYVIRGGQVGYDRLQVLARERARDTSDLFDRVGITEGSRCIDLGCGSGAVTLELANRVGSAGHVTGIDRDKEQLELVRRSHQRSNVSFEQADLGTWEPTQTYDIVYCRFVLQHLPRPIDLMRRM